VKVVVFGATGRIGGKLVAGGIARGHEVTAAARRPDDVDARVRTSRVVQCDILDGTQVGEAVAGHEAVIVATGARFFLASGKVHSRGIANVIVAMHQHACRRLVCVSAVGTHDEHDPNLPPFFTRVVRPLLLGETYRELRDMEAQVQASGLDWTLVHVLRLSNGPALGRYRTEEGDSMAGALKISRADAADFMLKELERGDWIGRDVSLSY
jgi:putative NADH-flavin reductase